MKRPPAESKSYAIINLAQYSAANQGLKVALTVVSRLPWSLVNSQLGFQVCLHSVHCHTLL